jgi:hypothetical protein
MDDRLEFYEERAAIMEFEGGMSRADAERGAAVLTNRYCDRKGLERLKDTQFYLAWLHDIEWSDEDGAPRYTWKPWVPVRTGY